MKLAVFDLDGTLAGTFVADTECFVQAFKTALGVEHINTSWSDYEHVTDTGVAREALTRAFNRAPTDSEISRLVECFVELLQDRHRASNHDFGEIPGASSFLRSLRAGSQWGVAIATGSWERSARFKIAKANLDAAGCPAAFAEDGPSRPSILEAAIARASSHYDRRAFERIVSIGDAEWDVQAARRLRLSFVGVGSGDRARALLDLGASHVLADFLNPDECLRALEEARIPD